MNEASSDVFAWREMKFQNVASQQPALRRIINKEPGTPLGSAQVVGAQPKHGEPGARPLLASGRERLDRYPGVGRRGEGPDAC